MSNIAGEISKRIRDHMAWSQAALAERLHISRNYVSLIESGAKRPSVRLLNQLEQMLTSVEGVNKGGAVEEVAEKPALKSPATRTIDDLAMRLDSEYAGLRQYAGQDVSRLGWLLEELRALRSRASWHMSTAEMRQAEKDLEELMRVTEEATSEAHRREKERRHA